MSIAFVGFAGHHVEQSTVDRDGVPTRVAGRGRHDPCVTPAAPTKLSCSCSPTTPPDSGPPA